MKKSSLGKITLLALGSILALSMFAACSSNSGSDTSTDEARKSSMYTGYDYTDYNGYDDSLTNTTDQNGYVNGSPFSSSNDAMTYDMEDFSYDIERTWDNMVDGIEGNMGGNYGTTNSEMLGEGTTGMTGYDPYGTNYGTSSYTTNGTDYESNTMK